MLDPDIGEPANATPSVPSIGCAQAPALRIDSRRLLAGSRELVIDHAGQQYRLRLTRNDKLILTK